jgi:hypothetical protein
MNGPAKPGLAQGLSKLPETAPDVKAVTKTLPSAKSKIWFDFFCFLLPEKLKIVGNYSTADHQSN